MRPNTPLGGSGDRRPFIRSEWLAKLVHHFVLTGSVFCIPLFSSVTLLASRSTKPAHPVPPMHPGLVVSLMYRPPIRAAMGTVDDVDREFAVLVLIGEIAP